LDYKEKNDKLLAKIEGLFADINKQIYERNCMLYEALINGMDYDQLAFEFSERIGNECGDFNWIVDHKGLDEVRAKLIDVYSVKQAEIFIL